MSQSTTNKEGENKRHKSYTSPSRNNNEEMPTIIESNFVTPGIFRRKINKPRRPEDQQQNDKKPSNNEQQPQFRWSIDQMAILRPANIDENDLSLPPNDWEPAQRTPSTTVEQFWTKHTHIAPSPDVIPCALKNPVPMPTSSSSNSCSVSSSSAMLTSPCSPEFESTRTEPKYNNENLLATGTKYYQLVFPSDDSELEEIERSLSFDHVDGDSILADLDDESGEFVRRQDGFQLNMKFFN